MSGRLCPVSKLDNLLLATDLSPFSGGAVDEAIDFAKKCSSNLTVMTVIETNHGSIESTLLEIEEKNALRQFEALRERALDERVSCESLVLRGDDPSRLIVEEAAHRKSDMIVIGRHGAGAAGATMGGITSKVIKEAPCKVLVVPKAVAEYRMILLATDGSRDGDAAVTEAVSMAKRSNSHLIVVSVVAADQDLQKAKVDSGDAALLAEKVGVEVETVTPAGPPDAEITRMALERGVDLIVMGAYGKTDLRRLFMGSTTEKVIAAAGCPVLVAKS